MAKFQQRHYEAIAETLAESFLKKYVDKEYSGLCFIEDRLAQLFASDNPNFKESKFRSACHKWTKDPVH